MEHPASELARRLAENAEAVCRHYLSNGVKCRRWWSVGDVGNTPGASLFVRLVGPLSGPKRAGKWTDYVAPVIMLRPGAGRRSCGRLAVSPQHNLSPAGRVA